MNGVLPVGSQNIELSSRLLDVTNERQLNEFLHELVTSTCRRTGQPLTPDATRDLVADLTRTAVTTVPTLSAVLGVGGPRGSTHREAAVGRASRMFGLELEGLSAEDRDFEIAREFVRFAQAASRPESHTF